MRHHQRQVRVKQEEIWTRRCQIGTAALLHLLVTGSGPHRRDKDEDTSLGRQVTMLPCGVILLSLSLEYSPIACFFLRPVPTLKWRSRSALTTASPLYDLRVRFEGHGASSGLDWVNYRP